MSAEWKPGDVAMVNDCTRPDAPWKAATCKEAAIPGQHEAVWILHDSGAKVWGSVSTARPLVVLDPEDREQVERLAVALRDKELITDPLVDAYVVNDMQAALREFANPTPPKPEEPTGLGAVVEDADGERFIRTGDSGQDDWRVAGIRSGHTGCWYRYSDIEAVRVLSEGVTS